MKGFPWWIVFSHSDGSITKVNMFHRSNSLYAQPPIKRVILGVRGVASFGISYTYLRTPSITTDPACQVSLIDVRLPQPMVMNSRSSFLCILMSVPPIVSLTQLLSKPELFHWRNRLA